MRQGEIDIAQVSKKITYDLYMKRDRDGYRRVSDRGGDSDDIDGDGGRGGGRDAEGDSDGVLGSHDVLCCVLERAYLIPLVCLRHFGTCDKYCGCQGIATF